MTPEHDRMAAKLGYSPDWRRNTSAVQDVCDLVDRVRQLGGDRYAYAEIERELAARRPPEETQMSVLRDIRDLLTQIRDRLSPST